MNLLPSVEYLVTQKDIPTASSFLYLLIFSHKIAIGWKFVVFYF